MRSAVDALRFDPDTGHVIREPTGSGYGYWAGGHKVSHDPATGRFVLFYRLRSPLEHGRGGVGRVAVSDDGVDFEDVWEVDKGQVVARSIEAAHCVRHDADEWRLYLSYEVDGPLPYWRVDVLRGPSPDALDVQSRRTVLLPYDYGLRTIKDPWIVRGDAGEYRVYASADAPDRPRRDGDLLHARALDATVLAESDDGLVFPSVRYVYTAPADDSWHGRRGRVNCLFPFDGAWAGTFDGGRTHYDNFEEWCGLVTSPDGIDVRRVDTDGPWVRSPHGSVRYVYGLRVGQQVFWYYEHTRADGSHDLRVAKVEVPAGC